MAHPQCHLSRSVCKAAEHQRRRARPGRGATGRAHFAHRLEEPARGRLRRLEAGRAARVAGILETGEATQRHAIDARQAGTNNNRHLQSILPL